MVLDGGLISSKISVIWETLMIPTCSHVECIRFCFMHIIRKELDQVAELWNQHIISSSKFENSSGPRGKTDCMYFLPHLYQTKDYKLEVELEEVEEFIDNATICPPDFSQEFEEFSSFVMGELGLEMPNNVKEGLDLYLQLIKEINKRTDCLSAVFPLANLETSLKVSTVIISFDKCKSVRRF